VTLIGRGATLAALQAHGLHLEEADGSKQVIRVRAVADSQEAGPQDYIFLTVKAQQVAQIAARLAPMYHEATAVLPAINGIPWWYFQKHHGPLEGTCLRSVDPDGFLMKTIPSERLIGCVVYPAVAVVEPGSIRHLEGERFVLGELHGEMTDRVRALSQVMGRCDLKAPVRKDIRAEIWVKLWGNLAINPLSVLTMATMDAILADPGVRAVCQRMMTEAEQVAAALGVRMPISMETRLRGAQQVGAHRTSMLQDVLSGRPLELDAILGAVVELAGLVGVPAPLCEAILALTALRARQDMDALLKKQDS
jgi:2-dehydropantoate 2-reductase